LKVLRDVAKERTIVNFKKAGAKEEGLAKKLDMLIGHRLIEPTSMDPYGVIEKLEHIIDVRDYKFKKEMKKLLPKLTEAERRNLENMLECTYSLEFIYKFVRHYFLIAEKSKNFYLMLQLSMILPQLFGFAKGIASAFEAFHLGQPIGDGIGPMILYKMMQGKKAKKIVKDTVCVERKIKGRKVYLIKAEGPGGSVGETDKAVQKILELDPQVKAILTIDAGLKMEGEPTGRVEEGAGVAIGGYGIEKYKIEKIASKKKISVFCILVKQAYKEAIGPIGKSIVDSIDKVIEIANGYILEEAQKGESIIVVGIGNTIGVGQ